MKGESYHCIGRKFSRIIKKALLQPKAFPHEKYPNLYFTYTVATYNFQMNN